MQALVRPILLETITIMVTEVVDLTQVVHITQVVSEKEALQDIELQCQSVLELLVQVDQQPLLQVQDISVISIKHNILLLQDLCLPEEIIALDPMTLVVVRNQVQDDMQMYIKDLQMLQIQQTYHL